MMKLDAFEMLQPQKTLMTTVVQHSQHFMIRLDSLMECPQNPLNCNGHDPCIETVLKPHQRCPAKQGMENHEESKESRDESRESLQNAVPGLRFWFPSVEDFLHLGDLFQAIHSRGAETPCPEGRLQDRRFAADLHLINVHPWTLRISRRLLEDRFENHRLPKSNCSCTDKPAFNGLQYLVAHRSKLNAQPQ